VVRAGNRQKLTLGIQQTLMPAVAATAAIRRSQ
jgi:hypothetical protein